MFTDLFVHQTTHMIAAMGVRYPGRVVGGGGLYLEYDGRDVPDVATIVADYDEGCQLIITATMINDYPIEEVIRGRLGTIKFVKGGFQVIKDDPNKQARHPGPAGEEPSSRRRWSSARSTGFARRGPGATTSTPAACGRTSWNASAPRKRDHAEHAGAGRGSVHHGRPGRAKLSHGQGAVLGQGSPQARSRGRQQLGAASLEARSKKHGKPNQVMGWHGRRHRQRRGPAEYQKLAGPWKGGKDPAETISGGGQ